MNINQNLVPVPQDPDDFKSPDEKRLWIGNLDPRINEYQLLKLMQKHGVIEKFDLLFHRSGPLAGQPRGYAFITYESKEAAITAKNALHNKQIGNRRITVTWAHSMNNCISMYSRRSLKSENPKSTFPRWPAPRKPRKPAEKHKYKQSKPS